MSAAARPGRLSRGTEAAFLAFSACVGAWSAPFVVAAALGAAEPSVSARVGCLALLAACWAPAWWLAPEPDPKDDPAPGLSRFARSLWVGGGIGIAAALVACLAAQVGEPRWPTRA